MRALVNPMLWLMRQTYSLTHSLIRVIRDRARSTESDIFACVSGNESTFDTLTAPYRWMSAHFFESEMRKRLTNNRTKRIKTYTEAVTGVRLVQRIRNWKSVSLPLPVIRSRFDWGFPIFRMKRSLKCTGFKWKLFLLKQRMNQNWRSSVIEPLNHSSWFVRLHQWLVYLLSKTGW